MLIPEASVRTTVTIDDDLYKKALELADRALEKAYIFREAMKTGGFKCQVRAGKRLAALGGTMPDIANVPRRRSAPEE